MGQGLRWWEENSVALREHLDDLSATEQARAASAVADERARIDSISVMVVQAGSARLRLRTDPPASEVALQSVEQTGRQALAEMRRMLGVLRILDGIAATRAVAECGYARVLILTTSASPQRELRCPRPS